MAFKVVRTRTSDSDLDAVFDFLVQSHVSLGNSYEGAAVHAAERLEKMRLAILRLGDVPFQGTRWSDARAELRWVTKERAIFYFETNSEREELRILAVFYGGQDHHAIMSRRLGLSH